MNQIQIPTKWATFTQESNEAMTEMAKNAAAAAAKLSAREALDELSMREVLVDYVTAWESYCRQNGETGAGDTAVRELVADFHDTLYSFYIGYASYELWEETRDTVYMRKKNSL